MVSINNYIAQIEDAINALSFTPSGNFFWFGKKGPSVIPNLKKNMSKDILLNHRVFSLQSFLYSNFYCKGKATAIAKGNIIAERIETQNSFVQKLSSANHGDGYLEHGWIVREITDTQLALQIEGITFWSDKKNITTQDPLELNKKITISSIKELNSINDSFYMAFGDRSLTTDEWDDVVRVYWNLTPNGAIKLMHGCTTCLNSANIPFRLKILKDLTKFTRCDSCVLYIRKVDYDIVAETIYSLYKIIQIDTRHGVPIFTKQLLTGVSVAESPLGGMSFGMHRCKLLAQAILNAVAHSGNASIQRSLIYNFFNDIGIDVNQPYLSPGSKDIYGIKECNPSPKIIDNGNFISSERDTQTSYLQTAVDIGKSITDSAIWYKNSCVWMGQSPGDKINQSVYGTIGNDIYSGTIGIAYYLANLYAKTSDKRFLTTALGAVNRSIAKFSEFPKGNLLGFYHGGLGFSYLIMHVGTILEKAELIEKGYNLINYCIKNYKSEKKWDVISGNAGSIIVLLRLWKKYGNRDFINLACFLGEELIESSTPYKDGCSWKTVNTEKEYDLTGFSHGTSGIGNSLIELYSVTQNSDYLNFGVKAFMYDEYWYDTDKNNWPDLRGCLFSKKLNNYAFPFCSYWCHGAPGIAFSRLRAYQLLEKIEYKEQAILALQNIVEWTNKTLSSGIMNFSLCHGFAGNASILQFGNHVLGDEFAVGKELSRKVADMGVVMFGKPKNTWICGTPNGSTPGLMLGLAGIGDFYLSMNNPDLDSPFIINFNSS